MKRRPRSTKPKDALAAENADKWLESLPLPPKSRTHWRTVQKSKEKKVNRVVAETAHVWVKEALAQNASAADYLEECLRMENLGPIAAVRAHSQRFKRMLVNDRKESGLQRYSDETLFHKT